MNFFGYIFLALRTFFCYLLVGAVLLVILPPLIITLLILPAHWCYNNRFIFWLLDIFYKGIVGALLVPKTVTGKENIPTESSIIIANHQSAADIPIVGSVLNCHPHIWYAMAYYATLPVLGFFIRRLGIPVSRENGGSAARSLIQGIKFAQNQKSHIIIFPEGGRFVDGQVHEFMHGFVLMARSTGRPVVPIFMPYNGKIYPPFAFWVRWHPLVVIIGPQFIYHENDTDETFVNRVYTWFVQKNSENR